MSQIGDLVPKAGMFTNPGVIVEKRDDGNVVVDTEPMSVNKYHRYANTTGLTEPEKNKFNEILDSIYTKENDVDKINDIGLGLLESLVQLANPLQLPRNATQEQREFWSERGPMWDRTYALDEDEAAVCARAEEAADLLGVRHLVMGRQYYQHPFTPLP